ncbi:MAG TPA: tyrosine-protein phosphatase, partial [Steroidobacteraceae bacterium]|nr:tyrosine-protein phosphatase [Steroidobacteraceae bacterium]
MHALALAGARRRPRTARCRGLAALVDYGIETVIDLRWRAEVERHPSPIPAALPQVHYRQVSLLTPTEDEWRERSADASKELWNCVVLEQV